MTDIAYPINFTSSTVSRFRRFVALLERSIHRGTMARGMRRTLDELPDSLLRDMGVARSEIPFVAGALASEHSDPTSDAPERPSPSVAERGAKRPLSITAWWRRR